jgi:hypothetical protein
MKCRDLRAPQAVGLIMSGESNGTVEGSDDIARLNCLSTTCPFDLGVL